MNKEDIMTKLSELGIITTNCYPKSTFAKTGEVYVGLFRREMIDDFYFYNTFDKKIYVFPKCENIESYEKDTFNGNTKFLVPFHECKLIWEDIEYQDIPDEPFSNMTLRTYACIHLHIPETEFKWLNLLIEKANDNKGTKTRGGS